MKRMQHAIEKGLEVIGISDHGPANLFGGVSRADTLLKIRDEVRRLDEKYKEISVAAVLSKYHWS